MSKVQELSVNAIRMLSADAVEKANSGHPGLPMGAAPIAYTLYSEHLKHNPANPDFFDRDRFVLSAGHGSMLLYSVLHLFGYGLTVDDLKNFRQLDSLTPGHPEYRHTKGVETTTGPLGQGLANGVGMALAEAHLAAKFNREGYPVVDHYTYVLAGDGCMMEGITNEAASLAGTWALDKLIVIYDSNNITIEGKTDLAFREDVAARYRALGWQILTVEDGTDIAAISKAIADAKADTSKPTLITVKTCIGYGCPIAGSEQTHGAPLGAANIDATRKTLGWSYAPFEVPAEVTEHFASFKGKLAGYESAWNKLTDGYSKAYPELYAEFKAQIAGKIPNLDAIEELQKFDAKPDATRNVGSKVLNILNKYIPNIMGGSADLGPSTKTIMKDAGSFSSDNRTGRNLHFGVREHAMAAISNGIYLHGGLWVYCSTFFVFSDYMKNAMRMSAIMDIPVVYVLTHDSIGVGEDGATHQPVEQLIALRSTPNMKVFRPCDGVETSAAWVSALTGTAPTSIVLTRQNLAVADGSYEGAKKGAYILREEKGGKCDVILMASGSEIGITLEAQKLLEAKGISARVVSVPCMELFDAQDESYRQSVLPDAVRARVAVEAASSYSWHKYTGLDGRVIGMDEFGKSAPADKLFELYGFTAQNVADTAVKVIRK